MTMDIVNLPKNERTPSEIRRIFAKNKFIESENGKKLGFEPCFFEDDNMVFLNEEDPLFIELYKREDYLNTLIAPEIPGYEEKFKEIIGKVADKIRIWLDMPLKNSGIDVNFVNDSLYKMPVKINFSNSPEDPWQPKLAFSYNSSNLSDHIVTKEFLIPLANDKGLNFARIGKCPECQKYIYLNDARKIFCSSQCRNRNFHKLRKEEKTA